MTIEPITDEELANLRVWLRRFPETSATTVVQLKSLIGRIDLERNRADAAEAECERLRAVVEAVNELILADLSEDILEAWSHVHAALAALAKLDNLEGTE